MRKHFTNACVIHPAIGSITVEYVIESYGSPGSYWGPGEGFEFYVDAVMSQDEGIRWFMPNDDYESIEELIVDQVAQVVAEPDDMDWLD